MAVLKEDSKEGRKVELNMTPRAPANSSRLRKGMKRLGAILNSVVLSRARHW